MADKPTLAQTAALLLMDKHPDYKAEVGGTSHYIFPGINGEIVYHINDACYARMVQFQPGQYYGEGIGIEEVRVLINQYKKFTPEYQKAYFEYVDFIVNRSPYKDIILTKRNWKIWGFAFDTNYTPSHVLSAATALRQGCEYPPTLKTFHQLKGKIGEQKAFIMSCLFGYNPEKKEFHSHSLGGHGVLYQNYIPMSSFKVLCEGKLPGEGAIPAENSKPMKEKSGGWRIHILHGQDTTKVKKEGNVWSEQQKLGKKVGEGWEQRVVCKEEDIINWLEKHCA